MKRNMIRTANAIIGTIPTAYDMMSDELEELHEMALNNPIEGLLNAITTAFRYGFVLGGRKEKAYLKRKELEEMKNSRFFKVSTIEQFKILKYININFMEDALELELIRKDAILCTDCNGEKILFYYDHKEEKVKAQDYI